MPTTTVPRPISLGARAKLQKYTFVTVVFEAEYDLLLMQARSMGMYCPLEVVELVVIIDNFDRPLSLSQQSRIKAQYGCLADVVQFIRSRELAQISQTIGNVEQNEERVFSRDLLKTVLEIHPSKQRDVDSKRLGRCMRRLGWSGPRPIRIGDNVGKGYTRPS